VTGPSHAEQRVAILLPTGRDAALTQRVLAEGGIECSVCADIDELSAVSREGVGAILIGEEGLSSPASFAALAVVIDGQPQWSDLPVMLLTALGADSAVAARALQQLGNVTLLERPLRVGALVSTARAALRGRQRQYQIRAYVIEREKSEKALRDADRRKDEFLATLAHELRNPLAPIRNAAHLMRMTPLPDPLQHATDVIERQVRHLSRLLEDLLDVSRISRGKIELRRSRVDLATVVADAVETSRPLIADRGHEFTVELPQQPVVLDVDATRIEQVISNLLNNAAKYTPAGGRISLKVEREKDTVIIRVKDSGIGIKPGLLAAIFDMFVQADNRLEREGGGLGIGLTLVRHFVQMHRGTITVTSEGPNLGSEFVVKLPLDSHAAGESADRAGDIVAIEPHATGLRILVVDDNRDSAETMSSLLQMLGNVVTTANAGPEALQRVAEAPPDVALLDIGMPVMNGYEVAERIRKYPGGRDILLVAMTGWGQEADRSRSRAAGFDHHLVKPVEVEQLLKLLERRMTDTGS